MAGYSWSFITTYQDDVPLGSGKMDLTSHFIRLGVGYKL
jgi:hypothetical protein